MYRSWWFNLILGMMVGLAVGYALAERQPVPPSRALAKGVGGTPEAAVPPGHPPVGGAVEQETDPLAEQVAQLEAALQRRPGDPDILVSLGNLYFDASRWDEAREAYEAVLQSRPRDASVMVDLAVCYRNLHEPERALKLLDRALAAEPGKWQALFNKIVVLHFDLHRHDEAREALAELERMRERDPEIPDLSGLRKEIQGNG